MNVPPKAAAWLPGRQIATPLGEKAWIRQLEQLVVDCTEADRGDERALLREMALLLRLAPRGLSGRAGAPTNPHQFETMLTAQAWESAALLLLGDEAGYMLSRGENQTHLASIFLPGMTEDVTATGASAALAVMAAQAAALAVSARLAMAVGLAGAAGNSGPLN